MQGGGSYAGVSVAAAMRGQRRADGAAAGAGGHRSPMFYKFTAVRAPQLEGPAAAKRLMVEMKRFPTREDLVWRLVDSNNHPEGLSCITDMLRMAVSMPQPEGGTDILLPLLVTLFGAGDDRPSFQDRAFLQVAWHVYSTPFVMETLAKALAASAAASAAASEPIARFLVYLALQPDVDMRERACGDTNLLSAVEQCCGDGPGGAALQNVFAAIGHQGALGLGSAAVDAWPGGRHENDKVEFRSIAIVPVAAEVQRGVKVFLPQADGGDQFLQWRARLSPSPMQQCQT